MPAWLALAPAGTPAMWQAKGLASGTSTALGGPPARHKRRPACLQWRHSIIPLESHITTLSHTNSTRQCPPCTALHMAPRAAPQAGHPNTGCKNNGERWAAVHAVRAAHGLAWCRLAEAKHLYQLVTPHSRPTQHSPSRWSLRHAGGTDRRRQAGGCLLPTPPRGRPSSTLSN